MVRPPGPKSLDRFCPLTTPRAMPSSVPDAWVAMLGPCPDAQGRLFCFPHAGGSLHMFSGWTAAVAAGARFETHAIALPGHAHRIDEPSSTDMRHVVAEIARALTPRLDLPYVLFGHSLGALLAVEVADMLRALGLPLPLALIVSSLPAPHVMPASGPHCMHLLPDGELLAAVAQRWGYVPEEFLADPSAVNFMIPALRADIQ